ncbi:MAG: hypothetical protein KAI24_25180 [Planctomycetes bacterium]|nr:hypothetical protein [Planctomycetota bacterium]
MARASAAATRPRPRPDARRVAATALLALALASSPATQQAAEPAAPEPARPQALPTSSFTTPDGSRFVVIRDEGIRQVHWAIASWSDGRDDPPGLAGLALATMHASLGGTWQTGSADAEAERAALQALDEAWQIKMSDPTNAANNAALLERDAAAAALGDTRTFRRVLAALPAQRPEVVERDGVAVFVLTTVEPALAELARLVVERREQQVLRGLARAWLPTVIERAAEHARHPRRRLHAELLALVMPLSPVIGQLEQPPMLAPRRAQAIATWQASQHPTRTVHVLYGDLDPERARATLQQAFATTSLPAPPARPALPVRPLQAQRRSIVPGMPAESVSMAWVLPADVDPTVLDVACIWLAEGRRAYLPTSLRKQRKALTVDCVAPWPIGERPGLLRIDASDPDGADALAADLIAACAAVASKQSPKSAFYFANAEYQRRWCAIAHDTRERTVTLAVRALLWPEHPPTPALPPMVDAAEVRRLLAATFASQPAIVEGRR